MVGFLAGLFGKSRKTRHSIKRSLRRRGGAVKPASLKKKPVLAVGQVVKWKWADNWAYGKVVKVHFAKAILQTQGKTIKMKGSATRPIYEVIQETGVKLLKSSNQLSKSTKKFIDP